MNPLLEEITGYLARVRADLATVIDETPAAAFDRMPGNGGWSGTGIIQHLGKVEGSIDETAGRPLRQGARGRHAATSRARRRGCTRSIDSGSPTAAAASRRPSASHPIPRPNSRPSWASLQAVRPRLLRAVATVDGRDLTIVSAPHPILGPLNGYEWVLFVGQHEARHLIQLRETLSAA